MSVSSNIPSTLISKLTKTAILAALQGGETLKKGFVSSYSCSLKEGRHNFVTEYDKQVEISTISFIKKIFPDHTFLGEEGGSLGENSNTINWVIDPIDGTVNFVHHIPIFSISIAATFGGASLCGVVFNPMSGELFIAEKDQGAYLNGIPLEVSKTTSLADSMLATGFPYNTEQNPGNCLEHFLKFAKLGIPIRRLGSAALDLAYVAAGRFDGFWEVSLQPWDFAAGMLLIQEAKGKISTYKDGNLITNVSSSVIASNSLIHSQMLSHLTPS